MRLTRLAGGAVTAMLFAVTLPLSAFAVPAGPAEQTAGSPGPAAADWDRRGCVSGRIASTANNLRVYRSPEIGDYWEIVRRGDQFNCRRDLRPPYGRGGYTLGGRYTACGVSQGNGWVVVDLADTGAGGVVQGYLYMSCVRNV